MSHAGSVLVLRLTGRSLNPPARAGANLRGKIFAVVAGTVAGADSIDGMALLRHVGMAKVFARVNGTVDRAHHQDKPF